MASTVNMTMNATARKVLKASSVGPMPPARRSPDDRGQYVPDCSACRLLVNLNAVRHRSLVRGNHGKANMQRGSLVVLLAAEIGGQGAGRALEPVVREIPGVVAGGSGGGIARVPSLAARGPGAAGFRDRCRRDRGGRHRVRARSRHVDQCRRLRRTGYIIAVIVLLVLGDALGWFVGWFGGARHRPAYPPRGPARPRRSRGRPAAAPRPGLRSALAHDDCLGPWTATPRRSVASLRRSRSRCGGSRLGALGFLQPSPAGISARPSEATGHAEGSQPLCRCLEVPGPS